MVKVVTLGHGISFIIHLLSFHFFIYFVSALAETNRAPFDLPEAESELVSGYHTEYSGMRFAFFALAEYIEVFVVCGVAVALFLGGYKVPFNLGGDTLWTIFPDRFIFHENVSSLLRRYLG